MQFPDIAHLKLPLKLRFESFQLDYMACQYDQNIHVKDCHQQILTLLKHEITKMFWVSGFSI